MCMHRGIKAGSQYDTGGINIVSAAGESIIIYSNSFTDVKFLDNLIG